MGQARPIEPRICAKCGRLYQANSGKQKYCQNCGSEAHRAYQREYMKNYYRMNPEKVRMIRKRAIARKPDYYQRMNKVYASRVIENAVKTVIGHYSGGTFKCACCGEAERDFLTLDHINGHGNEERIRVLGKMGGGYRFYKWLIKQGLPSGYAVLCMNCNLSKGKHGVCAHKRICDDEEARRLILPVSK